MIRASFGVWPPMASEALPVTHHFSWFDVSHMPIYVYENVKSVLVIAVEVTDLLPNEVL